jgi:putative membrane protein
MMPSASLKKNDKKAKTLIYLFSTVVFLVVVSLKYIEIKADLGFDVHVFAKINAFINGGVALLLLGGLATVKQKKYGLHRKFMLSAMFLSILFLLSYITHHVLAGDTVYPADAPLKTFYLIILLTHIFLAAVILPFILFTAYRALISEFPQHKKLARITWPIWFYVAVSGVIVYLMISPYYS